MFIITTPGRVEDKCQEAYEQGCDQTESEYIDALDSKDVFIGEQADLLQQVAALPAAVLDWSKVPEDLRNRLADYV